MATSQEEEDPFLKSYIVALINSFSSSLDILKHVHTHSLQPTFLFD